VSIHSKRSGTGQAGRLFAAGFVQKKIAEKKLKNLDR
jgi:hypothetical protein